MKRMQLKQTRMMLMLMGMALLPNTAMLFGQEYKVSMGTGRLELNELGKVVVEGHSGNEIIFSSVEMKAQKDTRAEGLRAISSLGLEDNTGLGLSVVKKGDVVEVRQLQKMEAPQVTIKVPKGVVVSYVQTAPYGEDVTFKNVSGEIEVSTVHRSVILSNVTGPMTVKTVHGNVEAVFTDPVKGPVSLISVHALVDVTLPVSTKASLNLSTAWGEVFVDPAFKIDFEQQEDEVGAHGGGKLKGRINGGGLDITLKSSHGNIYLRKK